MKKEGKIFTTTPIISAFLLGGLYALIYFLHDPIAEWFPRWVDDIQIGLMLFALWLVVSAAIRSANSISSAMKPFPLIGIGMLVSIGGFLIYAGFLFIRSKAAKIPFRELADGYWGNMLFFLVVATIISILVTINLKMKDKFLGNIVEVVFIGLIVGVFLWLK